MKRLLMFAMVARHAWDEPFKRAAEACQGKPYRLLTPRIGEPEQQFAHWWAGLD